MWTILQTEIKYHAHRPAIALLLLPAFTLYTIVSGSQSWFVLPILVSLVVLIQIIVIRDNEKTVRQHSLLPIPLFRVSVARILIFLLVMFVFHGVYFILYFFIKVGLPSLENVVNDMVMFFGLGLMSCGVYLLQRDILSGWKRSSRYTIDKFILFLILFLFINGIPLTLALMFVDTRIPFFINLIFILVGTGLMVSTCFSFPRRVSYLE